MFSTQTFSMTFSQPVEIPSLFWSYYYPGVTGGKVGSITVYKNADDTDPTKNTSLDYTEAAGYVWKETRDLLEYRFRKSCSLLVRMPMVTASL